MVLNWMIDGLITWPHKYFLYMLIISFNNTTRCYKELLFYFNSGNLLVNSLVLLYSYNSLLDIF